MVEMTIDNFFEDEEDDFFAEAFRSVSKIESSSVKSNLSLISQKDENTSDSTPVSELNELNQSINENKFLKSECKSDIDSKSKNVIHNIINPVISESEKSNEVNNRFIPGFTPKSKKRKFAGPAGMFVEEESSMETHHLNSPCDIEPVCKKLSAEDAEYSNISSSQLSAEELLQTPSWKKLQDDVSSNHGLLSTAKLYSIKRVLHDTAKIKLPKHAVVPLLCVYLKKFCSKDPVSVYMDDTGEIRGKIDKEVLELYGDNIKTGIAFILRKIAFVCNVMILEKSNLVSIYLNDGTVKHLQNWDSPIENETLSNKQNCVCSVTPGLKINSTVTEHLRNSSLSKQRLSKSKSPHKTSSLVQSFGQHSVKGDLFHSNKTQDTSLENHNKVTIDSPVAIEKDVEDVNMDEFDMLLGNLDEKSFLEDF